MKRVGGVRSQSSAPRSALSFRAVDDRKRQWIVIHDSEESANEEAKEMAEVMQCPCYVMRVRFKDGQQHYSVIDEEVWLMCGKHSRGVHLGTFFPKEAQDGTTTQNRPVR